MRAPVKKNRLRLVLVCLALLAGYLLLMRPWMLRYGAEPDEVRAALPGDELISNPRSQVTRAVTLGAPPAEVWAWLVQLGTDRAGWYSYDCLDNGCQPSATRILPEYQNLREGDAIPVSPDGSFAFPVLLLRTNEALALDLSCCGARAVWYFVLRPLPDKRTRLLVRFRLAYDRWIPGILGQLIFEPIHFFMERKMLINLRQRMPLR